jgi:hypothetical protein
MVTIIRPEPPNKTDWVADRRLYLDKDGNVVEGKGPNRVSLLVAAGCTMPIDTARKYGLVKDAEPEPAQVLSAVETPVVSALAEPEAEPEPVSDERQKPDTKPAKKPAKKSKK